MRILFIGCVESSYRLLSALIAAKKQVVGVITKKQSEFNSDFCDLSSLCMDNEIPYHFVNNINDIDSVDFVRKVSPDICFCFGWSQIIKRDILELFSMGVVGFHPAALPNNRGRHPLIWALVLGLKETASSFFMINEGADEGAIVSQEKVEIEYNDDARLLYDKVMNVAVRQELELVEAFEKGKVSFVEQSTAEGNSWRKRGKNDGRIDWRMSSRAIYNLVRGLTKPYAGAHFEFKGNEYKVWKVVELASDGLDNIEPGKIIYISDDGTADIKVGDGVIRLVDYEKVDFLKGEYLL